MQPLHLTRTQIPNPHFSAYIAEAEQVRLQFRAESPMSDR